MTELTPREAFAIDALQDRIRGLFIEARQRVATWEPRPCPAR